MFLIFRENRHKLTRVLLLVTLVALLSISLPSFASQMQNRSVTLGSSLPGASTQHLFNFDIGTTSNIASLSFEYCSNSPLLETACVAPIGLDSTALSLTGQTTNLGFSYDSVNSTANRVVLTRPSTPAILGTSSYTLDNIVNPTLTNNTTYVRIASYASADASGAYIDEGAVAFSTGPSSFNVGAFVPPYLTFCVGQTVDLNCSSVGGVFVDFGEFSSFSTSTATTQFSAATNDASGYNVFLYGQTLTSGNTIINPLSTTGGSVVGQSQFGFNLRNNTNPTVGATPSGPGTGVVSANYNLQNSFRFSNSELVAYSSLPTEFTRFTVSYIANVPEDQAPGIYATTLTYLAVASF